MKILEPDYYKEFKCIGSQCKNTCCAGWNIWIEKKSFLKYKKVRGEFGKYLDDNMRKRRIRENDNEYGEFILKPDGRCPLLNEQNLCELYINCGENYLSKTCQIHPRLINQYREDILERNLQLTCPVVSTYLVKNDNLFQFILKNEPLTEEDKKGRVVWAEVTEDVYNLYWESRAFMIDIAQFRDIQIKKRLIFIKLVQNRIKELIDKNEFEKIYYTIDLLKEYITDESSINLMDLSYNKNSLLKYEFISEIIKEILDNNVYSDKVFLGIVNNIAEFILEISEKSEQSIYEVEAEFETYFENRQYILENYIVYNLYTYYMDSLEDLNIEKVIINLIVSYLVIKIQLIAVWNDKKNLEDSQIEEILYMYSKNMQGLSSRNIIYEFTRTRGYDSLASINTLIF